MEINLSIKYMDNSGKTLSKASEELNLPPALPLTNMFNWTNVTEDTTNASTGNSGSGGLPDDAPLVISLYSTIFVLSVVGNSLVILTLAQNKRMRTVTNVFLLNLAVSDLLLGVFCMPFTLIGSLLRNFIFGEAMCRLINYFQGVSVSVGVWTLVSISLERFFAICRPLHSRQWQTISHAYKIIILIWTGSLVTMVPSVLLTQLIPIKSPGKYKCREVWPDVESERIFNIYLDVVLLVIPLLIMTMTYSLITRKLCLGGRLNFSKTKRKGSQNGPKSPDRSTLPLSSSNGVQQIKEYGNCRAKSNPSGVLRGTYDKNQAAKTRVVRMLFVVVVEFFVCWTPLYVVNTWVLFDARAVYSFLGYAGLSTVQLLAYISSCCNPLTYCFMHKKYRQGFLAVIGCKRNKRWHFHQASEKSGTMVSVFSTRAGSVRSEAIAGSNSL